MFLLGYVLWLGPEYWPVSYTLARLMMLELGIEALTIIGLSVRQLLRVHRNR